MMRAAGREGGMAEPQKWDYRILRLGSDKFTQGGGALPRDRDEWVNPYLEAMGGQGWELVAVVLDSRWADFTPTLFFKRPT
jgi:hypothetical protein